MCNAEQSLYENIKRMKITEKGENGMSDINHYFDKNWRFYLEKESDITFPLVAGKCGETQGYAAEFFYDNGWEKVNLPHDWAYRLPMAEDWCHKHGHYKVTNLEK